MNRFDNFNEKELAVLWNALTTRILADKPLDYLNEDNKIITNLIKEIDGIIQEDNSGTIN